MEQIDKTARGQQLARHRAAVLLSLRKGNSEGALVIGDSVVHLAASDRTPGTEGPHLTAPRWRSHS